ncbi:uncharacterized protein LOC108481204 [Gossypium arboreum]|uniref:uncharacterized protein LOC108481204 n=1 Tax=Gossypium arboreum TaxID=29729 RepID=UPI000818FAFF|nr:uncharacterized protein LOC108481204 [Gossypium arboreum]
MSSRGIRGRGTRDCDRCRGSARVRSSALGHMPTREAPASPEHEMVQETEVRTSLPTSGSDNPDLEAVIRANTGGSQEHVSDASLKNIRLEIAKSHLSQMFVEEYYINLYAGGKFVHDPHATVKGSSDGNQGGEGLNGEGVEVVCSKGFGYGNQGGKGSEGLTREGVEVAGNKGGDSGKCGEGFERLNGEGVEVVGTKGGESFEGLNGEGVKVASNKGGEGGEVEGGEGGEDFKCLNEEGVEVVGSKGDEGDGGLNSGVEEANDEGYEDESDSSLEDDYDYLMKAMYFSDGDNDEEFQEASQKWREVEGKTSRKAKEKIVDETKSKSSRK